MIRTLLIIVFLLLLLVMKSDAMYCDADGEYKIRCETTCEQDGDEKGVVIEHECGCWNKRDIKHVPTKIGGDLHGKAVMDAAPEPMPPVIIWDR